MSGKDTASIRPNHTRPVPAPSSPSPPVRSTQPSRPFSVFQEGEGGSVGSWRNHQGRVEGLQLNYLNRSGPSGGTDYTLMREGNGYQLYVRVAGSMDEKRPATAEERQLALRILDRMADHPVIGEGWQHPPVPQERWMDEAEIAFFRTACANLVPLPVQGPAQSGFDPSSPLPEPRPRR